MSVPILGAATLLNIAQAGAGVASGVATAIAGRENYRRGVAEAEANAAAANDAYILETHMLGRRQLQERAAAIAQRGDVQLQGMIQEASTLASAAAGGVGGNSVGNLTRNVLGNAATVGDRVRNNVEMTNEQLDAEALSARARAQGRINSVPPPTRADFLMSHIRGAGMVIGAYSDFRDLAAYDGSN